jgi:CheY-like chemotaxis protein
MAGNGTGESVDILLVEDNPGDVRLIREAFAERDIAVDLEVVTDGASALDFVHQRGDHDDAPRPEMVLLDLNLPKVDGLEVLEELKSDPELRRIPVVVLTGSEAQEDVVESYDRHTNAYLTKPIDPDEFASLVQSFERFWLSLVKLPPGDG